MAYATMAVPTLWGGIVVLAVARLRSGRTELIMERTGLSGELSRILIGGKSEDGSDFCRVAGGLEYSGIGRRGCMATLTSNLHLIYSQRIQKVAAEFSHSES
jgi:hypothetical protein